ncbi:MAG: LacI family DNA-binding transcriptional regulator [Candidatus Zhuqueibacterota bacterium]
MRKRLHHVNATIKDVAKAAAVSTATVSRVYNKPESVNEETRRKVLSAAQALNYSPQIAARALSLQRMNIIGVILPELGGEFFSELIRSIDLVAAQHNYHIIISTSHSHRNEVELLLSLMGQGLVDGLILMVPVLGRIRSESFPNVNIPIILLNLPNEGDKYIQINVDNVRGAYLVTKHLVDHGYPSIAMIRGPRGNFDADMREKGFLKALRENNISEKSDGQSYLERGDFTQRSGYLAMIRLLSMPNRPRAVFAANDEMAVGAFEAAGQYGISVPDQVAIVGFDDISISSIIHPGLTTVHLPVNDLGVTAAEKVIAAIENDEQTVNSPENIVLPTSIVIRESCGCINHNRYHSF